tara:strand:- start:396 stop:560 length:165 start_codon:yes stop_codon:yes gene_type:complete
MEVSGMVLQEVTKRPPYTTVVTLVNVFSLLEKKIPSCFGPILLRISAIGASKIV